MVGVRWCSPPLRRPDDPGNQSRRSSVVDDGQRCGGRYLPGRRWKPARAEPGCSRLASPSRQGPRRHGRSRQLPGLRLAGDQPKYRSVAGCISAEWSAADGRGNASLQFDVVTDDDTREAPTLRWRRKPPTISALGEVWRRQPDRDRCRLPREMSKIPLRYDR